MSHSPNSPNIPTLSLNKLLETSCSTPSTDVETQVDRCMKLVRENLQNGKPIIVFSPRDGAQTTTGVIVGSNFYADTEGVNQTLPQEIKANLSLNDGVNIVGSVNDGEFQGVCDVNVPEIGRYFGNMSQSQPNGHGTWYNKNGERTYDGEWLMGTRHGHGMAWFDDGAVYSGQWHENKRQGNGRYTSEFVVYEGTWLDDKMHGNGTLRELSMVLTEHQTEHQNGELITKLPIFDVLIEKLQKQVSDLETRIADITTSERVLLCNICFSQPVARICRPCGHASMCETCNERIVRANRRCPVCRQHIRNTDEVIIC